MSRLRPVNTGERAQAGEHSGQAPVRPWRRLTSRYWRWQAAVSEHPAFEPLRARMVRRVLVVAFALSAVASVVLFWTEGLWTSWLHYLTGSAVLVLDFAIIIAARGVTALPEHQLDERQLRNHQRLVTRAFWAVMFVVLATTAVLPQLIEEGVVERLDGGQVFALLWAVALLGGMTGVCVEAWQAPPDDQ